MTDIASCRVKSVSIVCLLLLSAFLSFFISVLGNDFGDSSSNGAFSIEQPLAYTIHAPIRINADGNFTNASGVIWGNGSDVDPYIIDGWDIDGTGFGYCIYIGNTTMNFTIKNCRLRNGTGTFNAPYYPDAGIILYNLTFGLIEDNICSNNRFGIILHQSNNVTVINNTCNNNINAGLRLYQSNGNNFTNNSCSNTIKGTDVSYSRDNKFYNNSYFGCNFYLHGILAEWVTNDIPTNNTANNKPIYFYKNQNMNNATAPLDAGQIIMANIQNFKIENLVITNGSTAILGLATNNIYIVNTTCSNNREYGIYCRGGSNSKFENIICNKNELRGIMLQSSSNENFISNSTFANNNYGVYFHSSWRNNISNSTIISNKVYGLWCYSANQNTIKYNEFIKNSNYAIYIATTSSSNKIHHNNFISNNGVLVQCFDNTGTNFWNTNPEGNYWSDYPRRNPKGTTLDGHIWSPFYNVSGSDLAKDNYPLVMRLGGGLSAFKAIRINNNSGFNISNGVSKGSGTLNDPYIFENWDINGTGQGAGIFIGNTSEYFIIRNCSVHHATNKGFDPFYHDTGIYLYNITNATIFNTTVVKNNRRGIYLEESNNCTIDENQIYFNEYAGVHIEKGWNNTFYHNNISWNNQDNRWDQAGLYLSGTFENYFEANYISNNPIYGLQLEYTEDNEFFKNEIVFNCGGEAGVYIHNYADYNNFVSNNISNSTGDGIEMYNSDFLLFENNTIIGNNMDSMGQGGVYTNDCVGVRWSNNTINNNRGSGLTIIGDEQNQFFNNEFSYNDNYGFYFDRHYQMIFMDNVLMGNSNDGIHSNSGGQQIDNIIQFNTISENSGAGIYFDGSGIISNNSFIHNLIFNNSDYGIRFDGSSSGNIIHHNNIIDNNNGDIQGWDGSSGGNFWNDTNLRGNYWSDFPSRYPSAVHNNFYWNTPYDMNGTAADKDNYPLAFPVDYSSPFIADESPLLGTTGDDYIFNCSATDDTFVSVVYVTYWFGNNTLAAQNRTMIYNSTIGNWELNIIAPWNRTEDLNYELAAVDPSDNWAQNISNSVPINDNDAPEVDAGLDIQTSIGTLVEFNGSASTDNIGIANYSWYIFYGGNDLFLYDSNPKFTFNIAGDYLVNLTVLDSTGLNGTDSVWVNVVDDVIPILSSLKYPSTVNISDPIEITISVQDPSGVDLVQLNFTDTNNVMNNVSMQYLGSQTWGYTISGQSLDGDVKFHIWANDTFGNWRRTMDYTVNVIDNIPPELLNVYYPIEIGLGNSISITADVFDNIGISEVKLNYEDVLGNPNNVTMSTSRGVNYSYLMPGQNKIGEVSFFIYVLDTNNNWIKSGNYIINITLIIENITHPIIKWITLPTTFNNTGKINIQVSVKDENGIKAVYINYTDIDSVWQNETMNSISNDVYSFDIPGQTKDGTVFLVVSAVNSMDNWNQTAKESIEIDLDAPPFEVIKVISTKPNINETEVDLDEDIEIVFSKAMDNKSFPTAWSIEPHITGTFEWSNENRTVTFKHEEDFEYNTSYTILIIAEKIEQLVEDEIFNKDFQFSFTTIIKTTTITVGPFKDEDGNPLEGVEVKIYVGKVTYKGTTDKTGKVTIKVDGVLADGSYDLEASKDGYKVKTGKIKVKDGIVEEPDISKTLDKEEGDGDDMLPFIIAAVIGGIIAASFFIVIKKKSKKPAVEDLEPEEPDELEDKDEDEGEDGESGEEGETEE